MSSERSAKIRAALQMMRRGRFLQGTLLMSELCDARRQNTDSEADALFADFLQRTGRTQEAETIALRLIDQNIGRDDTSVRCHFVLGNVYRERGDSLKEIEHLQKAASVRCADLELACWTQLRLIASVADLSGFDTIANRLVDAKRTLARHGDPRTFGALHVWLAEVETLRGSLTNAQHQLKRAEHLLSGTDDLWLKGYLAINKAVVSYHCADIVQSERLAHLALTYSNQSGHRATRRAANTTIGHIHLSRGDFSRAREYFDTARSHCETGSISELAILDSIAQVALHVGDLQVCRHILDHIERLELSRNHSKTQHYRQWALQTKIQLLLKEEKREEAKNVLKNIDLGLNVTPRPRVNTSTSLAAIETLLANGDINGSVDILSRMLATSEYIPPDLFAEMERLTAVALQDSRAPELATAHFRRATRTFETIGHAVGQSLASTRPPVSNSESFNRNGVEARMSLDYVRALIETRTRPEMFILEALAWLEDLGCAESCNIMEIGAHAPTVLDRVEGRGTPGTFEVVLGSSSHRHFVLRFIPRHDPAAVIAASEFLRVVTHIENDHASVPAVDDLEVLWSSSDWSSSDSVVFLADSMLAILKSVRQIARTDVSVLLTGETGVGKEIIARNIHQQSGRCSGPFSALNCAAIPRELLESQLFGFRKGAFSGATEGFQGVVRAANGGTLLLDEIGELPLDAQAKLLRFLDEGEVHPIGEVHAVKVNVRTLFATNNDLARAVKEGRFREDLFYRINVVPIRIPPLRHRREEIPLLVSTFSEQFGREFSKAPARFTEGAMELLILYSWPGNVRQLRNEIRRISALIEPGTVVTPELLSADIVEHSDRKIEPASDLPHATIALTQPLDRAVEQLERVMLQHALQDANGHIDIAARALGLSRKGLYLKRRRLRVDDPHRPALARENDSNFSR